MPRRRRSPHEQAFLAEFVFGVDAGRFTHGSSEHPASFSVFKPPISTGNRGAVKQLMWAIDHWIRPYLERVRGGVAPPRGSDGRVVMPIEPDWRAQNRHLKNPYGDHWQPDPPARRSRSRQKVKQLMAGLKRKRGG